MNQSTKDISACLVHTLTNGIGLRVTTCSGNTFDLQQVQKRLKLNSQKFTTIIMNTSSWTGIPRDPRQKELGGNVIRGFFLYLNNLSQVSDRVNASQSIKLIWSTMDLDNPRPNKINTNFRPGVTINIPGSQMTITTTLRLVELAGFAIEFVDVFSKVFMVVSKLESVT